MSFWHSITVPMVVLQSANALCLDTSTRSPGLNGSMTIVLMFMIVIVPHKMEERVGFEPTERFHVHFFSKEAD